MRGPRRSRSPPSVPLPSGRGTRALLAALLTLALLPQAAAHAVLREADPAPGAQAPAAPSEIVLRFSQRLDAAATAAEVVDVEGRSVGAATIVDARGGTVVVPLPELPPGAYAMSWRTLSLDGHAARGAYRFAVGESTLVYPVDTASHDAAGTGGRAALAEAAARTAVAAGLAGALGLPVFLLHVDRTRPAPAAALRAAGALALLGGLGALTLLALLADQAQGRLLPTRAGRLMLAQAGLLLAAGILLAATAGRRPPTRHLAALGAAATGALAAMAGAAQADAFAALDRAAVAVALAPLEALATPLLGGLLLGFAVVAPARSSLALHDALARALPLAAGALGVLLAASGAALLRDVRTAADWTHAGPRAEAVRLLALAALAAGAAVAARRLAPRLREGAGPRRRFHAHATLGSVLLLVAIAGGSLGAATLAPADADEVAAAPAPYVTRDATTRTTHVLVLLRPNPLVPGPQPIEIALHPLSAAPVPDGTRVLVAFQPPGAPGPGAPVEAARGEDGIWSIPDAPMDEPGAWTLHLTMERPDETARLQFQVPVEAPTRPARGDTTR